MANVMHYELLEIWNEGWRDFIVDERVSVQHKELAVLAFSGVMPGLLREPWEFLGTWTALAEHWAPEHYTDDGPWDFFCWHLLPAYVKVESWARELAGLKWRDKVEEARRV